jgi:phage/plasmid-like protein (TIGR03299 family)
MSDDMTLEDWIIAAGLDYQVLQAPVTFTGADGMVHEFSDRFVNYRSDNSYPFETVSDRYKIVQPREAIEFFRGLCGENGLTMSAAGCLRDGQRYWATAQIPDLVFEDNASKTNAYVLFVTSADGSLATEVSEVCERVVCHNTMQIALSENTDKRVRTKHSKGFNPQAVKRQMNLDRFANDWEEFTRQLKALQDFPMTAREVEETFAELLRPTADRAKAREELQAQSFTDLLQGNVGGGYTPIQTDKTERAIRGLADIMVAYETAPGAVPGTAYGALQGLTYYVDHVRGTRDDNRTDSAWFGQGADLKTSAFQALLNKV